MHIPTHSARRLFYRGGRSWGYFVQLRRIPHPRGGPPPCTQKAPGAILRAQNFFCVSTYRAPKNTACVLRAVTGVFSDSIPRLAFIPISPHNRSMRLLQPLSATVVQRIYFPVLIHPTQPTATPPGMGCYDSLPQGSQYHPPFAASIPGYLAAGCVARKTAERC